MAGMDGNCGVCIQQQGPTSTQQSPFMVNHGRHLRMGFEVRKEGKYPVAGDFVKKMRKVQEEAHAALLKSQDEMKRYADHNRGKNVEYKIGDKVLLSTKDLVFQMKERPTRKLTERFISPYKVKKIVSANAVELELPAAIRIHPVVNVSRIVMYKEQVEGQRLVPPAPVEIGGEQEYEVEKILNKKLFRGKTRYLVRWKGYMAEEDTWEKEEDLENAKEAIAEFEEQYGENRRMMS